ncbi:hypothetical protein ACN27F_09645 [Solwaraspora sp. WMMB335]|uniref:hypothetical protein n=1 Tax=Solwaraspora sp. WMMB335 TaxID=3404118 RepID=UPI003B94189C
MAHTDQMYDDDRTQVITDDRTEVTSPLPPADDSADRTQVVSGTAAVPDRADVPEDAPGDAPVTDPAPATGLFEPGTADAFRDRWREVQLRFVDDPRAAAEQAQTLVTEAVEALTVALTAQRDGAGGWSGAGPEDTERLRMVVRRYRDLLDHLLAS